MKTENLLKCCDSFDFFLGATPWQTTHGRLFFGEG